MGRRSNIDKLPPELHTVAIDCIRAHRHFTLDEMMFSLKELGFTQISRAALHRFLPELDKKDALCANPNEGTIVTIVERGTGEVRTVRSSASGLAIQTLIAKIGLPDRVS
ncbi:hypothetical protein [Candidatus Aalborgicola defluviihabitans]|uniref:hypothetical protein n=1 Tax=Candidatus Aalborgicola defluviihabitans TaxID=3386187 RepID=UPI0039093465|nr:DUF3486 family protein [Burkholderiales bacterium]